MSTRSNIYVKLQPETKGAHLKFNLNLLHGDTSVPYEFPIPDVDVPKDANYIGIYHHWDGYLSGVGKWLLNYYNTYEKALNLVMMGDLSTIIKDNKPDSYRGNGNEDVPPRFGKLKTLTGRMALKEEYAYLFKDGKWYYTTKWYNTTYYYDKRKIRWRPLTEKAIVTDRDYKG